MVNVINADRLRKSFGLPELPTEQHLLQQKAAQQRQVLQQLKGPELQKQEQQAIALRDKPNPRSTSWLSGLVGLGNEVAGRRDIKRAQQGIEQNNQGLAQSTAAIQEAQLKDAQAQRQYADGMNVGGMAIDRTGQLEGYDEKEKDRKAQLLAASIRASASRSGAAPKIPKSGTWVLPGAQQGDSGMTVHEVLTKDGLKFKYTNDQGKYGLWDEPPPGRVKNEEWQDYQSKVGVAEVKGKITEGHIEQKGKISLDKIALANRGKERVADIDNAAAYGRLVFKDASTMRLSLEEHRQLVARDGRKAVEAQIIQGMKADSAYRQLERKLDTPSADRLVQITADKYMQRRDLEDGLERQARDHAARSRDTTAKLGSKEKLFFQDQGRKREQLQMEIEAAKTALDTKGEHAISADERAQQTKLLAIGLKSVSDHDRMVEKAGLEAELKQRELDSKERIAKGELEVVDTTDARNFHKDMKSAEDMHLSIGDVLSLVGPEAAKGGNILGIGSGDVHEAEAMRFLFNVGSEGEMGVGVNVATKASIEGSDGTQIEYYVPSGEVNAWLQKKSKTAQLIYAKVQQMIQKIAKEQSGLEVPYSEYLRIRNSVGAGNLTSDEAFVELINNLAEHSNMNMQGARLLTSDGVYERYATGNKSSGINNKLQRITYTPGTVTPDRYQQEDNRIPYGEDVTESTQVEVGNTPLGQSVAAKPAPQNSGSLPQAVAAQRPGMAGVPEGETAEQSAERMSGEPAIVPTDVQSSPWATTATMLGQANPDLLKKIALSDEGLTPRNVMEALAGGGWMDRGFRLVEDMAEASMKDIDEWHNAPGGDKTKTRLYKRVNDMYYEQALEEYDSFGDTSALGRIRSQMKGGKPLLNREEWAKEKSATQTSWVVEKMAESAARQLGDYKSPVGPN